MRKYEQIWVNVKTLGICKVAAPKHLHARIFKAVKKERYMDLGYKLMLSERNEYVELRMQTEGNMIIFTLYKRITIGDL